MKAFSWEDWLQPWKHEGGSEVACKQWAGEFRGLWQKSWLSQAPVGNWQWYLIQQNTSELAVSEPGSSACTMLLPAWFISPRKRGEPEGFFEDQHYLTLVCPACSQQWMFSEWMRGQELQQVYMHTAVWRRAWWWWFTISGLKSNFLLNLGVLSPKRAN